MNENGLFQDCIQVAGVIDADEAALLLEAGVGLLGFPLRLPVNTEDLSEAEAAVLMRALHPPAAGVLITYLDDAAEIAGFARALGAGIVQLHGDVTAAELDRLRVLAPGLRVIKSLVVGLHSGQRLTEMVETLGSRVDAFITDTFDPSTGASGATGKTHDWSVSRELVVCSSRPVILAGGLTPANVRAAILAVGPAGVDVHTGVEGPDGRKDREQVRRFVAEARAGFAAMAARR